MSAATVALNQWALVWVGAISRACWQGAFAIGLAWILCRLLPRLPGRIQSWLWRLAYLKLLVALLWAPLELPLLTTPAATVAPPALHSYPGATPVWLEPGGPMNGIAPQQAAKPATSVWLLFLWLPGAGWCGAQLLLCWRRSRRLRTTGITVRDDSLLADHQALCRRLGVVPAPALLTADDLTCPVLVGVRHPVVVLPAMFPGQFERAQLRLMLAHELAHLKRRDLLWAWLPNLGRVLFFFHPLVWLAEREWRLAQEMACDEEAVRSTGASPIQYGALLLEVIGEVQRGSRTGQLTVGVAGSCATIKRRLVAIRRLRPAPSRGRRAMIPRVTSVLLAMGAIVGIIPWRLTAHPVPPAHAAALPERGSLRTDVTQRLSHHSPQPGPPDGPPKRPVTGSAGQTLEEIPQPDSPWRHAAVTGRRAREGARTGQAGRSLTAARHDPDSRSNVQPDRQLSITRLPKGEPIDAVTGTATISVGPLRARENDLATERPASPARNVDLPDPAASLDTLLIGKQPHPDDSWQNSQKALFIKPVRVSGVLFLPKPFVAPSAFMGWRRSPLSGRMKNLEVRSESPRDLSDRMKALIPLKQGHSIDPRAFEEVAAWAGPEEIGDGRALKKLLAQMSQQFIPVDGLPQGKPVLLDPKLTAFFNHQVEEKQRAREQALEEKKRPFRDATMGAQRDPTSGGGLPLGF